MLRVAKPITDLDLRGETFDKKAVDKWLCHPRNPLLFAENNLAFKSFRFTRYTRGYVSRVGERKKNLAKRGGYV